LPRACGPSVIDEGRRDGGQIYRRQPEGFKRPYAKLYGTEAGKAEALHQFRGAEKPHRLPAGNPGLERHP
jgi:hypothetical protein